MNMFCSYPGFRIRCPVWPLKIGRSLSRLSWLNPERFRPVAWVAVVVRAMGFLFMAAAWSFFSRPGIVLLLGVADLGFALAHGAGLLATRERHVATSKS